MKTFQDYLEQDIQPQIDARSTSDTDLGVDKREPMGALLVAARMIYEKYPSELIAFLEKIAEKDEDIRDQLEIIKDEKPFSNRDVEDEVVPASADHSSGEEEDIE